MQASLDMSYCGPPPLPDDLWGRFNLDPWLIGGMLLATLVFISRPTSRHQRMAFGTAMAMLAVIFISPLCALTVALFSARVVHHVMLVALAAPLLAIALPKGRRLPALLTPLAVLHAAIFWFWHAPDAYQLALSSTPVYWLMQLTLLGSATALWSAILAAAPGKSIGALLFLTIQMGLLGALLVFASSPLYLPHFATTAPFGLGPLEDQQLGGLIMWVPASLPYIAVGLWRLLAVLRAEASPSA